MGDSDSTNQDEAPVKGLMAKVKKGIGWLTADRRAEAEGAIEEIAAAEGDGDDVDEQEAEEIVDEAELHVRDEYGELAPKAKPDERPELPED